MFAQHLRLASRFAALGVGAAVLARNSNSNSSTTSHTARCDAAMGQQQLRRPTPTPPQQPLAFDHALDDREKDTAGFVGVFLDAASVARVQQAVGGSLGRNPRALIQLHPEPELKRSFAPLFGSKAKVVVRGVATDVSTQQQVIIVDVSVGGGGPHNRRLNPSKNGHGSVPTIAMASDSWDDDVSDLLGVDLARRLLENGILHAKGSWDGVLPGQVLDGIKYPPTRAIFRELEEPITCEGTVCASSDYDKRAAQCVVRTGAGGGKKEEDEVEGVVKKPAAGEGEGEEVVEGECPLCTYMMKSPCKDVFVVFKACIDQAGNTEEQEDLKRCESSATGVHECIQKFGLFRENMEEGEGGDEEEDEEISGGAPADGGVHVQAASTAKP